MSWLGSAAIWEDGLAFAGCRKIMRVIQYVFMSCCEAFVHGCNTLLWETVDGQQIAPLLTRFRFVVLVYLGLCLSVVTIPSLPPSLSPHVQCCGLHGSLLLLFLFASAAVVRPSSNAPHNLYSNVKSGGGGEV